MRRRDWYFLLTGPVLMGLAVLGCSEGTAAKPAKADAGANLITLWVPGMA